VTDRDSLYEVALELLTASAAILATTSGGAPTNRLVVHGLPAFDCCDSLFVSVGTLSYDSLMRQPPGGAPGSMRASQMPVVPIVPLTVTALRCVSRQAMPEGGLAIRAADADAIQTDARAVYADGWSLLCGLYHAHKDGSLFADYPCRVSEVGAVIPVAPEGGCLGWAVVVTVTLDGFTPA
jgi:hypothetical protein